MKKEYVVYSINNLVTGKRYIGRTERFNDRRTTHFYKLKKGSHDNKPLQNAWNKYNHDYFEIEIMEKCIDLEHSYKREKEIIELYGLENLYNITGGGKDDKLHCSYMIPYTVEKCSVPVYQIDTKTLEIVAEFKNSEEAGKAMGVTSGAIKSVTRGKSNTSCGFYWIRKEDYEANGFNKIENVNKNHVPIVKMDKNGKFLKIYESQSSAGRDIGRDAGTVRCCLNGRQKTCGGFTFRLATKEEILENF